MTIAFVITGLAVLWEINLSVLYRGWGEGQGKDMVAFAISKGKGKAIYLFLVSICKTVKQITRLSRNLVFGLANDVHIARIRESCF